MSARAATLHRSGTLLAFFLASASPASPRGETVRHTVEAGQTLWSIAHSYGVQVDDLAVANAIADPTQVAAGQVLEIRAPRRRPDRAVRDEPAERPRLRWPLKGRVTSVYGRRRDAFHAGIDVAATAGTIIVAAAPGRVVRAGVPWGRYGRVVLLEHDGGHHTLYAHASRAFVTVGQRVRTGQAIAAVGRTGNATGPHLHFEVWQGNRTLDPLSCLTVSATVTVSRRNPAR